MKIFIGGSKMLKALSPCMTKALDIVCEKGYEVLIGDCFGADRLVQEYLAERGYKQVIVFASGGRVRNNVGDYPIAFVPAEGLTGFDFYRAKDKAMAYAADHALMFWDGVSKGTKCNIEDMVRQEKFTAVLIFSKKKADLKTVG